MNVALFAFNGELMCLVYGLFVYSILRSSG